MTFFVLLVDIVRFLGPHSDGSAVATPPRNFLPHLADDHLQAPNVANTRTLVDTHECGEMTAHTTHTNCAESLARAHAQWQRYRCCVAFAVTGENTTRSRDEFKSISTLCFCWARERVIGRDVDTEALMQRTRSHVRKIKAPTDERQPQETPFPGSF